VTTYVGRMKFYNSERGFGFVREESEGTEHFVHATALPSGVRDLQTGQKIKFGLRFDAKRGRETATDVELIDE
jgi:cold shock protein